MSQPADGTAINLEVLNMSTSELAYAKFIVLYDLLMGLLLHQVANKEYKNLLIFLLYSIYFYSFKNDT